MMDLQKVKEAQNRFAKIIVAKLLGSLEANPVHISEIETVLVQYSEALAEIEKPINDNSERLFSELMLTISNAIVDSDFDEDIVSMTQQYAESYHAEKCKESWLDASEGMPPDGEYIVAVENDRGEVFATASFCEDGQFDDLRADLKVLKYQYLPEVPK